MRRCFRLILLLHLLLLALASPLFAVSADAQSNEVPQRGDGGLHVSGGGVVGYVGGSGSISGNVVGPGGGGGKSATRPAVRVEEPNAVMGGEVRPAQKAARDPDGATQVSSKSSKLFLPLAVFGAVALVVFVTRRPVRARFSR